MEWTSSDAWALEAVILARGLVHGGRVKSIIAAGDACNHAIFEYNELDRALGKLIAAGLVISRRGRFAPTDAALEIWNRAVPRRMGIIEAISALENALQALPIEGEVDEEPVLSEADFETAVRAYVS
jgi:hypothetical protein